MIRKYLLPVAAFLGVVVAVYAVIMGNKPIMPNPPAVPAAQAPYTSFIAGAGLIEADTENIDIGTPVAGIVSDIYVRIGETVEKGAPLFKIDDRDLQAIRLPAITKIAEKEALLGTATADLKIGEKLSGTGAIGIEELSERRFEAKFAEAVLATAKAQLESIEIEMERRIIRAPVPGKILQIKTHLGEFAQAGMPKPPLMMMGGTSRFHVRVDIDEYDAWRFQSGEPAVAFVRGKPSLKIPLTYDRTEPYVIPKKSLTGNGTERTDTRVLQVIYSFDPKDVPLYIGQQLDVYIKAQKTGTQ